VSPADRTGDRRGLADEGEDIEIVEPDVDETLDMIGDGRTFPAESPVSQEPARSLARAM
jgi:hypothetical protein